MHGGREVGGEARGDRFAMWPKMQLERIGSRRRVEGDLMPEKPLRVLIVEDDSLVALDLEASLRNLGHEVVGLAATASAALSAAAAHEPDLVLMDISLADGTDGIGAAVEIRERIGTPAVFVTGNSDRGIRQRAAEARPIGMLVKPVQPSEVAQTLKRIAALMV